MVADMLKLWKLENTEVTSYIAHVKTIKDINYNVGTVEIS